MSSYPLEAEKLLVVANQLAPVEAAPGRPSYTAHRRAASTAYYAVFHAIAARVVAQAFPGADVIFRRRVQRWVAHGDIRAVCEWVMAVSGIRGYKAERHIRALIAPADGPTHIDEPTLDIAEGFIDLFERRHQADYDHEAVFARSGARALVELAENVVQLVEEADTDASRRFYGLIAMQARVRSR